MESIIGITSFVLFINTYIYVHTCMFMGIHLYKERAVYTYMYIRIKLHICIYTYKVISIYIHICLYMCSYMYIYIHIHKYANMIIQK